MWKFFRCLFFLSTILLTSCFTSEKVFYSEGPSFRQKTPDVAFSNMQLGLAYLMHGDRIKAKQKLLKALNLAPNSYEIIGALAYFYEQVGELEEARSYYQKALTVSGDNGPELNNYGAFLCRQGKFYESEQYFLKAIQDENYLNTAGAYENAGICLASIPNYEKAKKYFQQALKHDPYKKYSIYELIRIELIKKKPYKALKIIQTHEKLVLSDTNLLDLATDVAKQLHNNKLLIAYKNNKLLLSKQREGS